MDTREVSKLIPHNNSSPNISNSPLNIKVCIRVRPQNGQESKFNKNKNIIDVKDQKSLTIKTGLKNEPYTFDWIADKHFNQEQIFCEIGKPIVEQCLKGYNCTVFAYGQSGSGKTFTIQGDNESEYNQYNPDRGLIPRCLEFLYNEIANRTSSTIKYTVKSSFIQIYNETIQDLSNPNSNNLKLVEDKNGNMSVDLVTEELVKNTQEALDFFHRGANNRTISATQLNAESSRSHCILTLTITCFVTTTTGVTETSSKFNLVDLAGSESQKKAPTRGKRRDEAISINKSLSTLGNVIETLMRAPSGKIPYIRYRDSKLTHLLKDSLGGNSLTYIIGNVSPCSSALSETLSTLRFVHRAKMIKNTVKVNRDVKVNVPQLQSEIKRLKNQVEELKGQLDVVPIPPPFHEFNGSLSTSMLQEDHPKFEEVHDKFKDDPLFPICQKLWEINETYKEEKRQDQLQISELKELIKRKDDELKLKTIGDQINQLSQLEIQLTKDEAGTVTNMQSEVDTMAKKLQDGARHFDGIDQPSSINFNAGLEEASYHVGFPAPPFEMGSFMAEAHDHSNWLDFSPTRNDAHHENLALSKHEEAEGDEPNIRQLELQIEVEKVLRKSAEFELDTLKKQFESFQDQKADNASVDSLDNDINCQTHDKTLTPKASRDQDCHASDIQESIHPTDHSDTCSDNTIRNKSLEVSDPFKNGVVPFDPSKLEDSDSQLNATNSLISELKKILKEKQTELKSKQDKISQAENTNDELNLKLSQLRDMNQDQQTQISKLQDDNRKLNHKITRMDPSANTKLMHHNSVIKKHLEWIKEQVPQLPNSDLDTVLKTLYKLISQLQLEVLRFTNQNSISEINLEENSDYLVIKNEDQPPEPKPTNRSLDDITFGDGLSGNTSDFSIPLLFQTSPTGTNPPSTLGGHKFASPNFPTEVKGGVKGSFFIDHDMDLSNYKFTSPNGISPLTGSAPSAEDSFQSPKYQDNSLFSAPEDITLNNSQPQVDIQFQEKSERLTPTKRDLTTTTCEESLKDSDVVTQLNELNKLRMVLGSEFRALKLKISTGSKRGNLRKSETEKHTLQFHQLMQKYKGFEIGCSQLTDQLNGFNSIKNSITFKNDLDQIKNQTSNFNKIIESLKDYLSPTTIDNPSEVDQGTLDELTRPFSLSIIQEEANMSMGDALFKKSKLN